jgi:hypothetical protein
VRKSHFGRVKLDLYSIKIRQSAFWRHIRF